MERRRHGRECKLEAVRLVRERGARDLGLHPNLMRNWAKAFEVDPQVRLHQALAWKCKPSSRSRGAARSQKLKEEVAQS
jgi:transposase-like protein